MCVMRVWVDGCESTFVLVRGVHCVPLGSISPQDPASLPAPPPPPPAVISKPERIREVPFVAPGQGTLGPREGGDNLVPPDSHKQCKQWSHGLELLPCLLELGRDPQTSLFSLDGQSWGQGRGEDCSVGNCAARVSQDMSQPCLRSGGSPWPHPRLLLPSRSTGTTGICLRCRRMSLRSWWRRWRGTLRACWTGRCRP